MQRVRNLPKSREKWQGLPNLEHPWKAISCDNSHPQSQAHGPAIITAIESLERALSPVSRINTLDPTQQVKGLEGGKEGCPLCPNVNKWPKGNDCYSLKCCYFSALHFKEGMKLDERGIMQDKKRGCYVAAFFHFLFLLFTLLNR